jgi:serine/threonine protein kinase
MSVPKFASPPQRVGPYEVMEPLGSGGMGTVYRARDPRLQRDVALKVLHRPADDDGRHKERFLDEARAAGGLNHPNILAVYDAATDVETPYLVTELIDGTSLRQELDAGRMSLPRVLDLATQISDGLAAAHEARLVHRDLKPENVMITRSGRAKIVDFGLAKQFQPFPVDEDTRTMTAPHLIVGTPCSMSPEQARGAALDFRSDQFSFGAMLYEMATGKRPFDRPTTIETLTAILHDDPPPAVEVDPRLPLQLQWLLERCLAKAPEQRYGATADLHHDLRQLRDGMASLRKERSSAEKRAGIRIVVAAALAALVGAASLLLVLLARQSARPDLSSYRFSRFATDPAYEGSPAFSPDGRTVAYVAYIDGVMQVMSRSVDASTSLQLTHAAADCRNPFWSPDGARIYYVSAAADSDALWSVGAAGGRAQVELRDVSVATMSPDGKAVVFLRDEGGFRHTIWVTSPPGATPRRFAPEWRGKGGTGISYLQFSPDGKRVALWANSLTSQIEALAAGSGAPIDRPQVWLFDYPSGTARQVLQSLGQMTRAHPFSWMRDSRRIVFGADRLGRSPGTHLWVGDVEADRLEPLAVSSSSEYEPAVSPDGKRIAFVANDTHHDIVEIPLDGSPLREKLSSPSDEVDPSWSDRGRFVYVTDRSGSPEIWLRESEGAMEMPVVTARNFGGETHLLSRLAVAPDGQRVAYQRRDRDGYFIWVSPLAGGPAVRLVSRQDSTYNDAPTWSPDGAWVAFVYLAVDGIWRLGKTRTGASGKVIELKRGISFSSAPRWSPDGQWITVESADGLSLISPDGAVERKISDQTWLAHAWVQSGQEILAVRESDDYRLQLVSIDIADGRERVISDDLGPTPPTMTPLQGFSASPDGSSVLTSIARAKGDIYLLDGFAGDDGFGGRLRSLFGARPPINSTTSP